VSKLKWRLIWTVVITLATFSFGIFFGLGYALSEGVSGRVTWFVLLYCVVFPWLMFPRSNDLAILFLLQLAYVFAVMEGIHLAYWLVARRGAASDARRPQPPERSAR
jgi:hypothetical protein